MLDIGKGLALADIIAEYLVSVTGTVGIGHFFLLGIY